MRQVRVEEAIPKSLQHFCSSQPAAPGSNMASLQQTAAVCSSHPVPGPPPSACGSRAAAQGSTVQAAPAAAQGRLAASHSREALGSAAALQPARNRQQHHHLPAHVARSGNNPGN